MRRSAALLPLLAVAALGGCHDDPPPGAAGDTAPVRTGVDDATSGAAAVPPPVAPELPADIEKQREDQEAWHAAMNEYARGLMRSFADRVYDPPRDGGLAYAEADVTVSVDGRVGTFHLSYDASRRLDDRVVVTASADNPEFPKGTETQIGRFGSLSLAGPYRTVVHYLPPVDLLLTRSKDGTRRIVTAPPHKLDVQVSYSVDQSDLVTIRGTSVRPQAEISHFEWLFWHGRYLLAKQWQDPGDSSIEYSYDDRETQGIVLLRRATIRKGESVFDVAFRYTRIDRK